MNNNNMHSSFISATTNLPLLRFSQYLITKRTAEILLVAISFFFISAAIAQPASLLYVHSATTPGCPPVQLGAKSATFIPDINASSGIAYDSPNGQAIGDYTTHSFSEPSLQGAKFVVVKNDRCANLLFHDSSTGNIIHLGLSGTNFSFGPNKLDETAFQWIALAMYLKYSPSELTADIIGNAAYPFLFVLAQQPREMRGHFSDPEARRVFSRVYIGRLFDVLEQNPSLQLPSDLTLCFNASYTHYPVLSASDRAEIAARLQAVWPKLSTANKQIFISSVGIGDIRTVIIFAKLLRDFIKTSPAEAVRLDPVTVKYLLTHPDLSTIERSELFADIANLYSRTKVPTLWQVETIKSAIDEADGIALSKSSYQPFLDLFMATFLSSVRAIQGTYTGRDDIYDYYYNNFRKLITQSEIDTVVVRYDATRKSIRDGTIQAAEQVQLLDKDYILNSPELITKLFDMVSTTLLSEVRNATLPTDEMVSEMSVNVQKFIASMKRLKTFNDSRWIFPLLSAYNPKVEGETETEYAARTTVLKNLWTKRRVFLIDYFGGLRRGGYNITKPVSYARIVDDFSFFTGNRLDVAVLRTQGNATGMGGRLYVNWRVNENPMNVVSNTFFHEGAHGIHTQYKSSSPWNLLQLYWFNHQYKDAEYSAVSGYSLLNSLENHAELISYWSNNGELWLDKAITEFKLGHKHLLNQFLVLSLTLIQRDSTSSRQPLVLSKLEPDGRHLFQSIDAYWPSGTLRKGQYSFNFKKKGYVITFLDHRIVDIREGALVTIPSGSPSPTPVTQ